MEKVKIHKVKGDLRVCKCGCGRSFVDNGSTGRPKLFFGDQCRVNYYRYKKNLYKCPSCGKLHLLEEFSKVDIYDESKED